MKVTFIYDAKIFPGKTRKRLQRTERVKRKGVIKVIKPLKQINQKACDICESYYL